MPIFGRRNNANDDPAPSGGLQDASASPFGSRPQQRRITHVAPGTRFQGEITGPTELLIEGEVEGEIRVDTAVMVGAEGVVRGPIAAQTVRVGGKVFGNVTAADRVEVVPSGMLEGDIAAPRIVIAEGAFFKGKVEMKGETPELARRAKGAGAPGLPTKASAEQPGKP